MPAQHAQGLPPSKMEVMELSATNLPNVRRLPGGRTRAMAKLEGPLCVAYETEEDSAGGLNPTWEAPFAVALQSLKEKLKISFYTKRTGRSNKFIGFVVAPLSDFAECAGISCLREYVLQDYNNKSEKFCNSDDDVDNVEDGDHQTHKQLLPTLRIRARLF